MKYLFLAISVLAVSATTFAQTVYSDEQIIKISDYINKLEKNDSTVKAELASMDQSIGLENQTGAPQYVIVCGMIKGVKKTTFPLKEVNLQLIKENGEVLEQKTSGSGQFTFANINSTENYTLKLAEDVAKTITADKIIIADCNGKTINTITKNGNGIYEYKVIEVDRRQLNSVSDDGANPVMKVKGFKENYKKMQEEVASSKTCKEDYEALKAKFAEMEKNYNALKASRASASSTNVSANMNDESKVSQYLKNIHFQANEAVLDEADIEALNKAAVLLKKFGKLKLKIVGYADSNGADSLNKQLSAQRASVVKKYLISKGVKSTRLTVEGFGSAAPIASNEDELGRAQNRRVEIKVK
ncbi:MAG: OmpA family protein [Burkholderiales bacterium]|nr:OmpA family protein [Bacteroidia bacterium]